MAISRRAIRSWWCQENFATELMWAGKYRACTEDCSMLGVYVNRYHISPMLRHICWPLSYQSYVETYMLTTPRSLSYFVPQEKRLIQRLQHSRKLHKCVKLFIHYIMCSLYKNMCKSMSSNISTKSCVMFPVCNAVKRTLMLVILIEKCKL